MNDTPKAVERIKKRLSAQMVVSGLAHAQPTKCEELLDVFDEATSGLIIFDAETGEMLHTGPGSTGEIWQKIAAQCLPGMPAELVSKAYGDWLDADIDPQPFAIGSTVTHRELRAMRGKVIERIEDSGELHTLHVSWSPRPNRGASSGYYSPRELEQVKA
jgi:hypothetical protein